MDFLEDATFFHSLGANVPDLKEVVLLPRRDGEPADVVPGVDVIRKLLSYGGQQQLFPNARLKIEKIKGIGI